MEKEKKRRRKDEQCLRQKYIEEYMEEKDKKYEQCYAGKNYSFEKGGSLTHCSIDKICQLFFLMCFFI